MKMKTILIFLFIFTASFKLYASLEEDKNEILKEYNYVEEDAVEPVLRELYNAALDSYKNNKFENAIFYFQKISNIREVYKETSFLTEAIEKMLNYPLYEAKNTVINEYIEKGRVYYENRQYLSALNIWEKILILEPQEKDVVTEYVQDCRRLLADPYYERGWEYFKAKEYSNAIDEWEYVLGLVPNYKGLDSLIKKTKEKANALAVEDLLIKAKKNYDLDNMKIALDLINQALKIDSKSDEAIDLQKSIISKMKRQYEKAFDEGANFFNKSEYEKAISSFLRALKYNLTKKQETEVRKYISKSRQELAKLKIGKVVAEPVVKDEVVKTEKFVDKEKVRKHYTQGLYYFRNGYIEKAISEWEVVLNIDPENERAYTSLQRAKADLNKK